ncbi:MAG: cyclophilin-like fold protein [Lachnospiraceae bacterium]|nr:cyclophilin-like fold protein [Lachnospiraceae bacterium]MDD3617088.1 cyclophilin-like fold protein [Lachnospiraceae bacterium]
MKKKKTVILLISLCMSMMVLSGCGNTETTEANQGTDSSTVEASDENMEAGNESNTEEKLSDETTTDDTQEAQNSEMTAGTYPDGTSPEFSDSRVKLTIDGEEVIIRLYDNTAVDAFMQRLPLENLNFSDLSGIEKPIDRPEEAFSLGEETPGYDPVTGDMVIYRPWGNFTIFYGDFRYSDELVPLGQVESGLDIIEGHTEDFTGQMELLK